jgi:hypothetical protein
MNGLNCLPAELAHPTSHAVDPERRTHGRRRLPRREPLPKARPLARLLRGSDWPRARVSSPRSSTAIGLIRLASTANAHDALAFMQDSNHRSNCSLVLRSGSSDYLLAGGTSQTSIEPRIVCVTCTRVAPRRWRQAGSGARAPKALCCTNTSGPGSKQSTARCRPGRSTRTRELPR